MGIFDKAKDLAENVDADALVDKAQDVVEEHGDKLPGGLGDKAADLLDKAEGLTDKLPGQGD
ncbi:MAG: antitoxin [Acidimicrobiales bacterium]